MRIDRNQNHIMLDLETMGTGPDAAIVAIGAVRVFAGQFASDPPEFYQRVDLQSAVDYGGVIEPSAVLWWMQQSLQARQAWQDEQRDLAAALSGLWVWMRGQSGVSSLREPVVWGNGAAFDNVILAQAFKCSRGDVPWKFRNDRCYRTLKALFPGVPFRPPAIPHHALEDARAQAEHMRRIADVMDSMCVINAPANILPTSLLPNEAV